MAAQPPELIRKAVRDRLDREIAGPGKAQVFRWWHEKDDATGPPYVHIARGDFEVPEQEAVGDWRWRIDLPIVIIQVPSEMAIEEIDTLESDVLTAFDTTLSIEGYATNHQRIAPAVGTEQQDRGFVVPGSESEALLDVNQLTLHVELN